MFDRHQGYTPVSSAGDTERSAGGEGGYGGKKRGGKEKGKGRHHRIDVELDDDEKVVPFHGVRTSLRVRVLVCVLVSSRVMALMR